MPNIIGATNFFAKSYENTVPMTLGGSVVAGAATVPVNNMTNYTDGDVICFVVDGATPALKQVFTGTKNGSNIINVVWTEFPTGGVNVPHSAGATVIDYVSATHWALLQKGITSSINQDGSLKTAAVQAALNITGGAVGGWTPTGFTPSSVVANGNRSYNLTFSANNLTNVLSPGMRLMTQRTVAAPTQCTSLNGSTQYWTKTSPAGMTFTDNFSVGAKFKLTSYAAAATHGRSDGTIANGFYMDLTSSGQVRLTGYNAGIANFRTQTTYQSVPLNKKVSAYATWAAGTINMYIDGVLVPSFATTGGTAPTTIVQAGDYSVGRPGAFNGEYFPGSIYETTVFSTVLNLATIQSYFSQAPLGTETGLVSAHIFNGNANDLNANANNLTANGAATATTADSFYGGQANGTISSTLDYGIVTAATFSTNTTLTVQVPEGCTIPTSGGVSAVSYATVKAPYGMPVQRGKWQVVQQNKTTNPTTATLTTGNYVQVNSNQISVPIGSWRLGFRGFVQFSAGSSSSVQGGVQLAATTPPVNTNNNLTAQVYIQTAQFMGGEVSAEDMLDIAAQTTYSLYAAFYQGNAAVTAQMRGDFQDTVLYAELAYL